TEEVAVARDGEVRSTALAAWSGLRPLGRPVGRALPLLAEEGGRPTCLAALEQAAADLRAVPAVGRSSRERGRREAHPGEAVAERPVDEHLELDAGVLLAQSADAIQGKLPGEDDPLDSELLCQAQSRVVVYGHLG